MKNIKQHCTKLLDEWELALLGLTCTGLLVVLVIILLQSGATEELSAGSDSPPIEPSRINTKTAYALLDPPAESSLPAKHAFNSGLKFRIRERPERPTPEPPSEPTKKPPQPESPPEEPPPKEPEEEKPEKPPQPKFHTYVYEGYKYNNTGDKIGIMQNKTTGNRAALEVGSKWRGLMVSSLRATEVVFLTPDGREKTLEANQKIRIRLK